MATQEGDGAQQTETQECMPCEGRGSLISRLGGEESTVSCPWCEGSGERRKGIDAQAHWAEQGVGAAELGGGS
jgi:DnaJ-class molecular chaperone